MYFFFKSSSHKTVIKLHSNFAKVTKRAIQDIQDIQDNGSYA
jgi:hypothetical protein